MGGFNPQAMAIGINATARSNATYRTFPTGQYDLRQVAHTNVTGGSSNGGWGKDELDSVNDELKKFKAPVQINVAKSTNQPIVYYEPVNNADITNPATFADMSASSGYSSMNISILPVPNRSDGEAYFDQKIKSSITKKPVVTSDFNNRLASTTKTDISNFYPDMRLGNFLINDPRGALPAFSVFTADPANKNALWNHARTDTANIGFFGSAINQNKGYQDYIEAAQKQLGFSDDKHFLKGKEYAYNTDSVLNVVATKNNVRQKTQDFQDQLKALGTDTLSKPERALLAHETKALIPEPKTTPEQKNTYANALAQYSTNLLTAKAHDNAIKNASKNFGDTVAKNTITLADGKTVANTDWFNNKPLADQNKALEDLIVKGYQDMADAKALYNTFAKDTKQVVASGVPVAHATTPVPDPLPPIDQTFKDKVNNAKNTTDLDTIIAEQGKQVKEADTKFQAELTNYLNTYKASNLANHKTEVEDKANISMAQKIVKAREAFRAETTLMQEEAKRQNQNGTFDSREIVQTKIVAIDDLNKNGRGVEESKRLFAALNNNKRDVEALQSAITSEALVEKSKADLDTAIQATNTAAPALNTAAKGVNNDVSESNLAVKTDKGGNLIREDNAQNTVDDALNAELKKANSATSDLHTDIQAEKTAEVQNENQALNVTPAGSHGNPQGAPF